MKTPNVYRWLVTLLPGLVIAMGCSRPAAPKAESTANSQPESASARVVVGKPQQKTLIASTTQPGRIEAFEDTPIFSRVAGYVEKVHVDIGDKVTRDQPLVTIQVPELADDVRQKTALVAQAEAQVKQAATKIDAAKAAVDTADARVAEATAELTRANAEGERWKSEHARVKELVASGSLTEKLGDETLNQSRAAEASREAARAGIRSAEAGAREARVNVAKSEADRDVADARLSVAKAELARANTMLNYATIRAPFDGVVISRDVDTGHLVQSATGNSAQLLNVARNDQVRVFVDVPELEATAVDDSDPATIRIQALPDKSITAKVTRTSWSLKESNRSLRVEVDIPNAESLLRPGMYATVTIERDRRNNALVIPVTAMFNKNNETCVSSVISGKVEVKPVRLGLRSGPEIEVLDGLDAESVVVLTQGDKLEHGQPVEASAKL
jgi:RND family efflux transporter MFP subunit